MIRIVSDTSTLYSSAQAWEAVCCVSPLSVTVGGPGCVAVQYIEA